MAATPKHKRSASKRNSTRSSNRFDKLLTKFKKIKKYGGNLVGVSNGGIIHPSHKVSKAFKSFKQRVVNL